MKVFFDALGCPKALVDAERMCYFIEESNHILVSNPDEADAVIINTCGFIDKAKKENIDAILQYTELKKKKPELKIILSGCLTERYRNELLESLPEVDSAIGVRNPQKILDALNHSVDSRHILLDNGEYQDNRFIRERKLYFSGLHYAYIKISEGCNRNCSFCAIPGIRGKQRSRPLEDIIREAEFLALNGVSELILISEDTISYGTDIYREKTLPRLISRLAEMKFRWIRIMYLFPEEDIFEIVHIMQRFDNICNYIDMPLQHVSEKILKSMKRSGNSDFYLKMIRKIRKIIPSISIRTSFIIGYPGEDENDFKELTEFISEGLFDRIGFFEYSSEEGTEAFTMKGKVARKTVKQRIQRLSAIQAEISENRLKKRTGSSIFCINDGITGRIGNKEYLLLRSEYDAPEIDGNVFVKKSDRLMNDDFIKVKIESVKGNYDLFGEVIE